MAKEAVSTGSTNLSNMWEYGWKKYLDYFFTSIIIGLIVLIGFLFMVPGLISISSEISQSGFEFANMDYEAFIPLLYGLMIMIPYMLIISVVFSLVNYAVVIDDLSAIKAVKKGLSVFWKNKLTVFIIWLIIVFISFLFGLLGSIPYIGGMISLFVSLLIVAPLTTVWYSKFYMKISKS
jgi:hypothetical protein